MIAKLPAGMFDIGAAAVVNFAVGLYAVKAFESDLALLGVYSVFFAALILAIQASGLLVLQPAEVIAVEYPTEERLARISGSLKLSLVSPAIGVVIALLVGTVVAPLTAVSNVVALGTGFILAASLAPSQEHIRRMLHLSDRSWEAAQISAIQLPVVGGLLVLLTVMNVPRPWIPFSVLGAAHTSSWLLGIWKVRSTFGSASVISLRQILPLGRWLFLGGVSPAAGGVIAASLVGHLAGASEVGYAESARVVGRPLLVLAAGLMAVVGPKAMEAGSRGDRTAGGRMARLAAVGTASAAGIYALMLLGGPVRQIVERVVPRAFEKPGLVFTVLGANLVLALGWSWRQELIGMRQERRVALIDGAGVLALIVVALASKALGAFAIPVGLGAFALVAGAGYWMTTRAKRGQVQDPEIAINKRLAQPNG